MTRMILPKLLFFFYPFLNQSLMFFTHPKYLFSNTLTLYIFRKHIMQGFPTWKLLVVIYIVDNIYFLMHGMKWKCGWIIYINMWSQIIAGSSRRRQINEEILKYGAAKNDVKIFTFQELIEAINNFSLVDLGMSIMDT